MSLQDITLPEVKALQKHARFYKDGELDFVEISFTGSKDTNVLKVTPDVMAEYRDSWIAYKDGEPLKLRAGTPLTSLNGVDEILAQKYISQHVHNVEELAALSDAQCQALGHGTLTLRKQASERIALRAYNQQEATRKLLSDASASIGPVPAETYASKSDLAELSGKLDAVLAALAPKKPGRPKKDEE